MLTLRKLSRVCQSVAPVIQNHFIHLIKARENGFDICLNIRSILLNDVDYWGGQTGFQNTAVSRKVVQKKH